MTTSIKVSAQLEGPNPSPGKDTGNSQVSSEAGPNAGEGSIYRTLMLDIRVIWGYTEYMADDKPFLTDFQATKAYHRLGWEPYARKAEAEQKMREQNTKVLLREKRMRVHGALYTFSVIQRKKGEKPYVRISGYCEPTGYRGTIVVFAPYVPAFVGMMIELSKGLE